MRHRVIPAVYVLLRRRGKALLLRRANTGYEDGSYTLPSGHLDGGETAREAAAREAWEEAGVRIPATALRLAHVVNRRAKDGERVDFYFTAERWAGEPENREPVKCSDLRWFPLAALPKNTIPDVRVALESIQSAVPYSEAGWPRARPLSFPKESQAGLRPTGSQAGPARPLRERKGDWPLMRTMRRVRAARPSR